MTPTRTTCLASLILSVPAAAQWSQVQSPGGDRGELGTQSALNHPPQLFVGLEPESSYYPGMQVRFDVTASDPDGDPLTVTLANPLTGMLFAPVRDEAGPVTREVSWLVGANEGGLRTLVFEASDGEDAVRVSVPVHLIGAQGHAAVLVADVTGDGVLDVVAGASKADKDAVDSGAVYVWDGTLPASQKKSSATLRVSGAKQGDQLAFAVGDTALYVGDVTGDGVDDVLAAAAYADVGAVNAGALHLWKGGAGLAGTLDPTATLRVAGAGSGETLGSGVGVPVMLFDVTGDGVRDVIVTAPLAGSANEGAAFVWHGGAGLAGSVDPDATLTDAGAVNLGASLAQGQVLADLNGDGLRDIVLASPYADLAGGAANGGVYAWFSGPGLAGQPAADVVFAEAGAFGTGLRELAVGDATGDGIDDVVADAGTELLVFAGSAGLTGTVGAAARLRQTLGGNLATSSGIGILLADVTGDGLNDVLSMSVTASFGSTEAGAAFMWAGGPALSGTLAPTATLGVQNSVGFDRLGDMSSGGPSRQRVQGLMVEDLTGDGVLDVVAGGPGLDRASVINSGGLAMWSGGSAMQGTRFPTAMLQYDQAQVGDSLGSTPGLPGTGQRTILFEDVTGDGQRDVIVAAPDASSQGLTRAGAIYLWPGGSSLAGTVQPLVRMQRSSPLAWDYLAYSNGQGLYVTDVTGDGRAEVVAASYEASGGAGAIFVFELAAGAEGIVSEAVVLAAPGATAGTNLTGTSGDGLRFADVSGDGLLDLLGARAEASSPGIEVWFGGPALTGATYPNLSLTGAAGTALGNNLGEGFVTVDLDGDPELEILAGASDLDYPATTDAGGLLRWLSPLIKSTGGTLRADAHQNGDRLGT